MFAVKLHPSYMLWYKDLQDYCVQRWNKNPQFLYSNEHNQDTYVELKLDYPDFELAKIIVAQWLNDEDSENEDIWLEEAILTVLIDEGKMPSGNYIITYWW